MNTTQFNNWFGIVSNMAVLVGIIFLAVEINQNSDVARAQIHQSRSDAMSTNRFYIADTEFLTPAIVKMGSISDIPSLGSLNPEEYERIRNMHSALYMNYDNLYYQYENGYLEEAYWEYRVVPYIKKFYPIWEVLRVTEDNRPSFEREMKRIMEL